MIRLLLVAALAFPFTDALAQNLDSLRVEAENRCALYNRSEYRYPQSIEPRIVERQGGAFSPYDGTVFESLSESDIEHIVAVSEAHDSGLCRADSETKKRFATDLDNLTLARPRLNRYEKIAKDAAQWLPSQNQCWYAKRIVQVKAKYGLSVDAPEKAALATVLGACGASR